MGPRPYAPERWFVAASCGVDPQDPREPPNSATPHRATGTSHWDRWDHESRGEGLPNSHSTYGGELAGIGLQ